MIIGNGQCCSHTGLVLESDYSAIKTVLGLVHSLCAANLTLEDMLQFFNGAPYFTSMSAATVRFADPVDTTTLPRAHACSSELVLPSAHRSYRGFRTAMTTALNLGGTGFGLA